MLTDFGYLIKTYSMQIDGIIHVGAHFGQEYKMYKAENVKDMVFIEPCRSAYTRLLAVTQGDRSAICIQSACGSSKGLGDMFIETRNQGQSNSLLKPVLHTEQYPDIVFHGTEKVQVDTLDNLLLESKDRIAGASFNMLVMDVQGYEHEVLRGAVSTLQNIDYIYTEVNNAELYEGCARVETLDAFLSDFTRAHTNWAGKTWGDALYIRKKLMVKTV